MSASTVVAIAAGAAVLATTVAVLAWRERSAPESRALAGLMAAAGVWAGLRAVRVAVASLEGKLFVATVEWVPIGATAVLWVAFANRYTGREFTGRWVPGGFAGVAGLASVAVLLRLTNASHGLVVTGATVTTVGEARLLSTSRGPLFARSLLATQRRYRAQALVVVAAALSPVVASALYALGLLSVDPAPYALSVTGVGMLWAVRREDLLSARPAPSSLAREAVVERTDDAVVVVDGADRVVDGNPAARALLPVDGRETPSAAAVVPGYDDLRVGESATVTVETDAGTRFFDARVVPLREAAGGSGRAISLRDVTDRRIRAQRLAVLNRVLRHNIRNDMNVVTGYAEMLDGSAADAASRTAERVARIAEETRDVVRLLDDDSTPTPARPVAAVVDDALDRAPAVNGDDGSRTPRRTRTRTPMGTRTPTRTWTRRCRPGSRPRTRGVTAVSRSSSRRWWTTPSDTTTGRDRRSRWTCGATGTASRSASSTTARGSRRANSRSSTRGRSRRSTTGAGSVSGSSTGAPPPSGATRPSSRTSRAGRSPPSPSPCSGPTRRRPAGATEPPGTRPATDGPRATEAGSEGSGPRPADGRADPLRDRLTGPDDLSGERPSRGRGAGPRGRRRTRGGRPPTQPS